MLLNPYDRDALKRDFDTAQPFRHLMVEEFLEPEFALEVANAYPSFEEAQAMGFAFDFVNERKKVQISDASKFPEPIAKLNEVLASREFLADLEYITGIPNLLADPTLAGGGMHVTGPHGRLDVHVDFNYSHESKMHRRLNILVYLNPNWNPQWGGAVELWDPKVKKCYRSVDPMLNRMVIFETSHISYHGVTPLTCPPEQQRRSFAAYYYTREAPVGWDGTKHDTIFRARPSEKMSKYVYMPLEKARRGFKPALRSLKKKLIG